MFTPGFRLFFGFTLAGFLAMFVYGVASGDGGGVDYLGIVDAEAWLGSVSLGWKGGIGDHVGYTVLMLFALMSGFIAVMLVAFRDADPDAVAELAGGQLPAAQAQTVTNYWPVVGAFGMGVVVIGLVTQQAIFVVGLIVMVAVIFEWMMSAWADRATGDPAANKELRSSIMGPIEVPVLATLGIAALVLAMSRVFLSVSAAWAVWVAAGVSAVIMLIAIGLAAVDKPNKNLVAGVVALAAVGALAGGVVAASVGEREFHDLGEELLEAEEGIAE